MDSRSSPAPETFTSLPDLGHVKRRIPIVEVARELRIRIATRGATWTTAHCFRLENHKSGDRTPSLNFQTKKNKFMCFACDEQLHSNIDLVMAVEGYGTLPQALRWFDERYPGIPRYKARKPLSVAFEFRAGVDELHSLEDVVRAGIVPHLTESALRALTAIWAFRDGRDVSEISYETIKLRTGIKTNHTVQDAIAQLEGLGIIEVHRRWGAKRAGGRAVSQYTLTFDDPKLFATLASRDLKLEKSKRAGAMLAKAESTLQIVG